MFQIFSNFIQNNRVEDYVLAPVLVSIITTFIFNLVYEWQIKKYIEVDRELLLIKKQEQANFIAKCQNIGLFFGNLSESEIWLENDYEHFKFLVEEQYSTLKQLLQDLPKVFYFRDQENKDNLFFQQNFFFFLGYLIGRNNILKKRVESKNIKEINILLPEFQNYSEKFQLFDNYFAMKFTYNGIFLDKLKKVYYKFFKLKKVKLKIKEVLNNLRVNKK
jgi:hypothetical protein